jgi:hypothetical protein
MVAEETERANERPDDAPAPGSGPTPSLGPYRGPVVVLALVALIAVVGLAIAVVGAVRSPKDVSSSATILGTFPIDPDGEGIPPGPVGQPGTTPASDPAVTSPPTASTEGTATSPPADPGDLVVLDPFDGDLAAWEAVDGDWTVADGALVAPAASDDAPTFLLATGDRPGIGGEIEVRERAAGLVVGYADPSTYVAALEVPALGGWRIEVRIDGELVDQGSEVAPTAEGTVVQLGLANGEARLVVDGELVGSVPVPAGIGSRSGFISRGPAGARWAAALEGP